MKRYADVVVPFPLPAYFTYELPQALVNEVEEGSRVVVPFGPKRFYTGIVRRLHDKQPQGDYQVKAVVAVLDPRPVALPEQLRFWEWMADYYLCTPGDVCRAAMPSGLRLESETRLTRNTEFVGQLTERELRVMAFLPKGEHRDTARLERESGLHNLLPIVRSLLDKGAVEVCETLRQTYRPKTDTFVRLAPALMHDDDALNRVLDQLQRRAPKQWELLLTYLDEAGLAEGPKATGEPDGPADPNERENRPGGGNADGLTSSSAMANNEAHVSRGRDADGLTSCSTVANNEANILRGRDADGLTSSSVVANNEAHILRGKNEDELTSCSTVANNEAYILRGNNVAGPIPSIEPKPITRSALLHLAQTTSAALTSLVDKGILELYQQEVGRLHRANRNARKGHLQARGGTLTDEMCRTTPTAINPNTTQSRPIYDDAEDTLPLQPLSTAQRQAYEQINEAFAQKEVCLLYGVTGSGKTEVYIHLIADALKRGEQVLYLLPEIALTEQIMQRLERVFGPRLGIYHSRYSDAERVEVWQRQLGNEPYEVVLGVRSSLFLPFRRLGLVIVDEEHEPSYKQHDPAPRYHGRNAALMLAAMHHAKTLLGTATPSLESWHHAHTGKYALVELNERYHQAPLPQVMPVDVRELRRKKLMTTPFSPQLLKEVRDALDRGEQAILFQNRRGYAPMVECHTCGWVPRCKFCDVSLTFHKRLGKLTCHYCGYTCPPPRQCPACQSTDLKHRGMGTERIEDDIQALLPTARVARMDLDSTRSRAAYGRIITDFDQGETDILIGTQMVSKGLDFGRVSVVGILGADAMLSQPDFRAYERAFQLMAQVAGRSGRRGLQGHVVLQTRDPSHPIIAQVRNNDYEGMASQQLAERQAFGYPPFSRLVYIYLKHKDEALLEQAAQDLAKRLRNVFGRRLLGPDRPPVARVQTLFIRKLVLKVEVSASMTRARQRLKQVHTDFLTADKRWRTINIYYDVDPV